MFRFIHAIFMPIREAPSKKRLDRTNCFLKRLCYVLKRCVIKNVAVPLRYGHSLSAGRKQSLLGYACGVFSLSSISRRSLVAAAKFH